MNLGIFLLNLLAKPVYANCPICIVTVGGGLFIAKKLGIDDLLVSIWLSGLNCAIAFWLASRIKNHLFRNPILWSVLFYILTVVYLLISKQTGHPKNTLWGIDKVLFGMTIGFIVFIITAGIDRLLRNKNKGKVLFPYQKVILPVVFLLGTTLLFKALL